MYRRNSTILSAQSVVPPHGNGHPGSGFPQHTAGISPSIPSATYPASKLTLEVDDLNPDHLFSKHTVSEVKTIQQRLRHDADAKQEELRLMVGERYRDLLQASSSIISIAASSRRVLDALEECRGAIIAQEEPPLLAPTGSDLNDAHLRVLQTLSAHMKVLLDAPEHLWRLIERKKYFPAAWLFLFTRVVHRALVRSDDQDSDSWSNVGVDVLTEFPLVQRQWDEVTTFRSQIIHKATLSLREIGIPANDVCATLVTLHLLDSRPLNDTLTSFLGQRSKALHTLVSWRVDQLKPMNGHVADEGHSQNAMPSLRLYYAKEVSQANQKVLNVIFDTISTAKRVFENDPHGISLISRLLGFVQSEMPVKNDSQELPVELKLSTHSLLTHSSSSAHFLLLPANLQSYRPYIDLDSLSVTYSQGELFESLRQWSHRASELWKGAADIWFSSLTTVTEIWALRSLLTQCITKSEVEKKEQRGLTDVLDGLCHSRIFAVWKLALEHAEVGFKNQLRSLVTTFDPSQADAFFEAPPLSLSPQSSKPIVKSPFQQYQLSLKRQLLGRTAQLEAVLTTLESCARNVQKDLSIIMSDGEQNGRIFGKDLANSYQPIAETLSSNVASILEVEAEEVITAPGPTAGNLIALAMVTDELTSSSIFVTHIGCKLTAIQKFRSRIDSIQDRILERWREQIIERIVLERFPQHMKQATIPQVVSGPSPRLLQSLLSLSAALQQLGVIKHHIRHESIIRTALRSFISKYLVNDRCDELLEQNIYNLFFLKAVAGAYDTELADISASISGKIESYGSSGMNLHNLQWRASEYLARTQTLFSVLLPCSARIGLSTAPSDKFSSFLLFGAPALSQEFQPAIELAKPSSRFGLLLVSNRENN